MVPGCKGSGVQQHYRFYFAFYPFLRQVGEKVEQNLIVDHGCGNAAVAGHKSVPGLYPVIQIQHHHADLDRLEHIDQPMKGAQVRLGLAHKGYSLLRCRSSVSLGNESSVNSTIKSQLIE